MRYNKFNYICTNNNSFIMKRSTRPPMVVDIAASSLQELTLIYVTIFLAKFRLTGGQLELVAHLARRYSTYVADGVEEPYTSKLLFSTDTRKEISKEMGVSSNRLANLIGDLTKVGSIIVKGDEDGYSLNPVLIPPDILTFRFIKENEGTA